MYALFAGQNYYPRRAMGDYKGIFKTIGEAKVEGKKANPPECYSPAEYEWFQIVKMETMEMVEHWSLEGWSWSDDRKTKIANWKRHGNNHENLD